MEFGRPLTVLSLDCNQVEVSQKSEKFETLYGFGVHVHISE